jgi:Flp pilus assembly protein TadD
VCKVAGDGMDTRDLLLLIGFLRGGKMFPAAVPQRELPGARSLRHVLDAIAEQERQLFGAPISMSFGPRSIASPTSTTEPASVQYAADHADLRKRTALTAWSGDFLAPTSRIAEVPDPGVLLCLLYDGPVADAALPIDVFAQTLRRYALRDAALRARFDEHVQQAGTFVPPWLSPEARRQRSQEAFDRAMGVAREQGFAAAAPLFEGVRGDCFAPAQIAIAVHELRELGDGESALGRLDEVVRIAPRNVAARMARAQVLMLDAGRRVDAAADYLAVLRELRRPEAKDPSPEVEAAAKEGLWALHREYGNPRRLESAATLARVDPDRGFEAVSRYVHTHPCAWDAQVLLASLALQRESFDLTIKLLGSVRWIFPDEPNPHFVYGQALACKGDAKAAVRALEHAARLAPDDADVARWLTFGRDKVRGMGEAPSVAIKVAHHMTRTLLLLVGFVRGGRVSPAAVALHKVPGEVSLELVVQALAAQEQRRFGDPGIAAPTTLGEADVAAVRERVVLLDHAGSRLGIDQLVGDVPDPGVLVALLYEAASEGGPPAPSPTECRAALAAVAQTDTEIAAKMERHLKSDDATLMARLDLAG